MNSLPYDSRSTFKSQSDVSRLLLVDDFTAILQVYEMALRSPTRELVCVTNGKDALEQAAKKHFDLILLDVQMPGMSGWEVCRELKSEIRTQNIPVLFASGAPEAKNICMELGAVGFLNKPFALTTLREAVEKWEKPNYPITKLPAPNSKPGPRVSSRKGTYGMMM